MNAAAEIALLEKWYLLPSEQEHSSMDKTENDSLIRLASRAIVEAEQAEKLAGKDGFHCYFCGYYLPTSTCGCAHTEHFRCAGKRVCANCEQAMKYVANHLAAMFSAKRVNRITSIRERLASQLRQAAREVGNEDVIAPTELHFCLAQADATDDEYDEFRSRILRSFGRCKFLRFQALAEKLKEISEDAMIRAIVRSGIVGRTRRRGYMKPEDEQFYR